ncbi:MAG: YjbH domain-containing protein [Pseudomonadota bacterium]
MGIGDAEDVWVTLTENGIPLSCLYLRKEDLTDYFAGKLSGDEFLYLSTSGVQVEPLTGVRRQCEKRFDYQLKPSIETFLNDPSGFFRYRLGISASGTCRPWSGASFVAGLAAYPVNNVRTTNDPLSVPVRSDIVDYKKEHLALDKLLFDQIERITPRVFGRFSAGLLEIQYAGFDGELAAPVLDGRVMLGLSGSAVKKRAPARPFGLKDDDSKDIYTTAFLNTRINLPEYDMALDLKAGRFLAGDKGVRITVSKFVRGVVLYAWYSVTDTSIFRDEFNRHYHDKGFGVVIPLRLFEGKDTRTTVNYALSPWTRDVAQDIVHHNPLFDFIGRNTKVFLDRDGEMMRE